jgi:single-strand DNA-binding protein|tara:strand:+ start:30395 stop:30811 length:417 start_codon:yes stop_codon:yes gene_type:complete
MVGTLNKAMIIGYLGGDPELKRLDSGKVVATFSLATSSNWVDDNGEIHENTEWHRVVVWGKKAENCGKYLAKGRRVYVEGRLQTRTWEDQQGIKRYTTEITASVVTFLSPNTTTDYGHESPGYDDEAEHFSSNSKIPF